MSVFNNPQLRELLVSRNAVLNPIGSVDHVAMPGTMEGNVGYQVGTHLPDVVGDRKLLRPLGSYLNNLGTNSGAAALGGAAIGGVAGMGYGMLTGRKPLNSALAGAAIGGAGSLGLSKFWEYKLREQATNRAKERHLMFAKKSFYAENDQADPMQFVQARLFADQGMTSSQKSMIMQLLPSLQPDQASQLAQMLRGAGGAGVGYAIARFLLNLGVGGQVLSSIVGGLAGMRFGGLPTNSFGNRVNTQFDPFGQRRLLF